MWQIKLVPDPDGKHSWIHIQYFKWEMGKWKILRKEQSGKEMQQNWKAANFVILFYKGLCNSCLFSALVRLSWGFKREVKVYIKSREIQHVLTQLFPAVEILIVLPEYISRHLWVFLPRDNPLGSLSVNSWEEFWCLLRNVRVSQRDTNNHIMTC